MAALFRNFSFEAAARDPACNQPCNQDSRSSPDDERHVLNVSPTAIIPFSPPARLPTPPPCSMGDLANILDKHSLRITVDTPFHSNSHVDEPLTPPSDNDVSFSHHATQPLQWPSTDSVFRLRSATLRMQRQANVRMQCSTARVKDIERLVKMMVDSDQCNICEPKTGVPPSVALEDEGVDMDYTPPEKDPLRVSLPPSFVYRASERDTGARVSKRPRMRKPRFPKK